MDMFPFKRCATLLPTGRQRVSSCLQEHPKKEDFKVGRGGKEEFSINATECQSRQSTPTL